MVLIGMGKNPFSNKLNNDPDITTYNDTLFIYPRFFDSKRLLLNSRMYWRRYLEKVIKVRPTIALYPDYLPPSDFDGFNKQHPLPVEVKWVYPLHSLTQMDDVLRLLSKGYDVIVGYASGLNDYTLSQFYEKTKDLKIWYLGVSTKRELNRVLHDGFHGFDLTTNAFGAFRDVRSYEFVKSELLKVVRRAQSKFVRLF